MNIRKTLFVLLSVSLAGAACTTPVFAQETPSAKAGSTPAGKPSEAEIMAQMTALAKPGEQHRLLAGLDGTWNYTVKFATAPGAAMAELGHGVAERRAIMGGRYFVMDTNGKMMMPGPDGKMQDAEFQGMSTEGYDNVKQKYFSTWIDSMGTSIVLAEGSYDAATKSFTYNFEMEPAPGLKTKAREVVKFVDADHYQMEWYEHQGGQEVNTMEIDYTRKK